MAAKIFIDGEAGTTGLQIRERLAGRSDLELLSIPEQDRKDPAARADFLNRADVAILCLPDAAARESVAMIENPHTRVIDASSAHRVAPGWTYGFAEMAEGHAETIAKARFVTNPGCWPQGLIALVRPLVEAGIVPADHPVSVNGVTGYSGGGRQMIAEYEENPAPAYMPYGLTFEHKHLPEMTLYTGLETAPLFQPAVGDFYRGMLVAVPLHLDTLPTLPKGADLHAVLVEHFRKTQANGAGTNGEGFVSVAPFAPVLKSAALDPQGLNQTNRMQLFVFANDDTHQALLMAVFDNLGKGASGAAVQNLNLMLGIDMKTSLIAA